MRKPIFTFFAVALCAAAIAFAGCDSSASNNDEPAPPSVWNYYVDAASGDDLVNTGASSASPFKTISKALSVAASGQSVKVAPGTYDAANGETFPISIPAGVSLIGDEANKGGGDSPTTILGAGQQSGYYWYSCVSPGEGSQIAGFIIIVPDTQTEDAMCITILANSVVVRDCAMTGANNAHIPENGVFLAYSSSDCILRHNVIRNKECGLAFVNGGGADARVEGNEIGNNGYGAIFEGPLADLGGGASGSAGGNVFTDNSTDISISSSNLMYYARNNSWDTVPPVVSTETKASEIFIQKSAWDSGTRIDTTGARAVE